MVIAWVWLMASGSEFLMERLARETMIERNALVALRYHASVICVSMRYGYVGVVL